jgi:hypothetical protein
MKVTEENLKRILAGNNLKPTWKCKIGFHTWSQQKPHKFLYHWQREHNMEYPNEPIMYNECKMKQCLNCGKTKMIYD